MEHDRSSPEYELEASQRQTDIPWIKIKSSPEYELEASQRQADIPWRAIESTPEFDMEASPGRAYDQCERLWPCVLDDTLEQMRRDIPNAWYQRCRVITLLQLCASSAKK